jgi:putative ABC transport system ATP-binding protein
VSLSGPSGSGKTLLLRALAVLDPVDEGELLWRGRPVSGTSVPPFRAEAVYLHQRPALIGTSVEDTLRRPLSLDVHRRRSFDRQRDRPMAPQAGAGRVAARSTDE